MNNVIHVKDLVKHYYVGDIVVKAIQHIDLDIDKGEFVSIMGASGSGKSTLMNILGCLDQPTSGQYLLDGQDVSEMSKNLYADIRNKRIGFVFQNFNLLPRTSALENVELPLLYNRSGEEKDAHALAEASLRKVGLEGRMEHVPNQLSGGEKQRVAIARALVNDPAILLADEPTGNLDSKTSVDIMRLFQELNKQGITILLVTHEKDIAEYTKRTIYLRDGKKLWDRPQKFLTAEPVHDAEFEEDVQ